MCMPSSPKVQTPPPIAPPPPAPPAPAPPEKTAMAPVTAAQRTSVAKPRAKGGKGPSLRIDVGGAAGGIGAGGLGIY